MTSSLVLPFFVTVRTSRKTCAPPVHLSARNALSSVLASSSRISRRPWPWSQVRAVRQSRQAAGGSTPKEVQVVAQRRLSAFGSEQKVASSEHDIGAERVLCVQGIR